MRVLCFSCNPITIDINYQQLLVLLLSPLTSIKLPLNSSPEFQKNSISENGPPSATSSLEVEVLGDLLRQFFDDNLTLDQKIELMRDENLCLKSKLFHALCGISDDELWSSEEEDVAAIRISRDRRAAASASNGKMVSL